MAGNVQCPTCHNKRTVTCPCCQGKGWVAGGSTPQRLSKAYSCVDCSGIGEIPCPACRPTQKDLHIRNIRVENARLRFGHA